MIQSRFTSPAKLHCHKEGTGNLDLVEVANETVSKRGAKNQSLEGGKQPFAGAFEKGVLKIFAIFTGKHLCWSLQHRCCPVNIAKYLRTAFL